MLLSLPHRLNNISREVISNVSCAGRNCTCDWSMKVGTMTRLNSAVQSKSSVKLARLILWHYAVSNETILRSSKQVQGKNCLSFDFPMQSPFTIITTFIAVILQAIKDKANKTQTAMIVMAIKCMLQNKVHLLDVS